MCLIKSIQVGDAAAPIAAPYDKNAFKKTPQNEVTLFERPKPNEGYAPEIDVSGATLPFTTEPTANDGEVLRGKSHFYKVCRWTTWNKILLVSTSHRL